MLNNTEIVEIHSDEVSNQDFSDLVDFCQKASAETKHAAAENMIVENWENRPASLLYVLLKEKRFARGRGGLFLRKEKGQIIAVSGYYASDFNPQIFIIGVRTWVLKEHRFHLLIANSLLPLQLDQVQKYQGHTAIISFNDSTKSFAELIRRSNKDPSSAVKFFFGKQYPEIYKDMIFWPEPVKIKGVKQWILIKNLAPSDFDFNSLAWKS